MEKAKTMGLYFLMCAFPGLSAYLTIDYIVTMRGESWSSAYAAIGIFLEVAKVAFCGWVMGSLSCRFNLRNLMVFGLSACLMLVSMAASKSYLSSASAALSARNRNKSTRELESSQRYSSALLALNSSQQAVEDLQKTIRTLNAAGKATFVSREVQGQLEDAQLLRDQHMQSVERMRSESNSSSPSSNLFGVKESRINEIILILLELCPIGFACIQYERRRILGAKNNAPDASLLMHTPNTPSVEIQERRSETETLPGVILGVSNQSGVKTKIAPLRVVRSEEKNTPGTQDETLRRIVGAIESGACRPSYSSVQEYLHCGNDEVPELFKRMRDSGFLERSGNRHVVSRSHALKIAK